LAKNNFNFFNPKAGISFSKNSLHSYLSFSIANKEPNRDDFESGKAAAPKPERLYDVEYGIEKRKPTYNLSASLFYMKYKNQLVLTGKINDVGAYTRTNIPHSYRAGVELQGMLQINSKWNAQANIAFSENKVINFTEYIDDYDTGGQLINHFANSPIALSPFAVSGATINYLPVKNVEISFISKYVSKQYLDNTGNNSRALNAFYIQDARAVYILKPKANQKIYLKEVNIILQVNNIFNKMYEPNGYTFSYFTGGKTVTENFYFPMAGSNFMFAVNMSL
jgi:iron complex outermembrane receptor protein